MLFQPYLTVNFSTPPILAGEISQIEIEVNDGTLSLILTTVAEQCNGQIISYDVSLENSKANCYHDISPNWKKIIRKFIEWHPHTEKDIRRRSRLQKYADRVD
jgi:hypothetical protein